MCLSEIATFVVKYDKAYQALFLSGSLFFLRYTVLDIIHLQSTSFRVITNFMTLNSYEKLQYFGKSAYVTFVKGADRTHSGRTPTKLNEDKYVNYLRGLDHGDGKYNFEDLLYSFKSVAHMHLCLLFTTYSFVFTVVGFFKPIFAVASSYVCLLALVIAVGHLLLLGYSIAEAHFAFKKLTPTYP